MSQHQEHRQQQEQQQQQDGPYDPRREQQSRSIRAGTQVVTKAMRRFVASTTRDGQYNFDLAMTYSRIGTAARFIKRVMGDDPARVLVFSSKEIARESVKDFCEATGTTAKVGRFMPGTLTNPSLSYYTEPSLVVVSDPQMDAQAVTEATNAGIPVVGIASTESIPSRIDMIIPANNRDRKAIEGVYKRLSQDIEEAVVGAGEHGAAGQGEESGAATGGGGGGGGGEDKKQGAAEAKDGGGGADDAADAPPAGGGEDRAEQVEAKDGGSGDGGADDAADAADAADAPPAGGGSGEPA